MLSDRFSGLVPARATDFAAPGLVAQPFSGSGLSVAGAANRRTDRRSRISRFAAAGRGAMTGPANATRQRARRDNGRGAAMPRISIEEINELCERSLPWVGMLGFEVEEIGKGTCRVRLPPRAEFLRPGGPVSGPALMSLADYGMYVAVLSAIGRVELTRRGRWSGARGSCFCRRRATALVRSCGAPAPPSRRCGAGRNVTWRPASMASCATRAGLRGSRRWLRPSRRWC